MTGGADFVSITGLKYIKYACTPMSLDWAICYR